MNNDNSRNNSTLVVRYRPVTRADLGRVCTLERQIFSDPWPRRTFEEMLEDDAWGGLVAEVDGRVIGYACYVIIATEAHLANMAVQKEYRRKSVAHELLEHILRVARTNKCEMLLLEVRPSNDAARRFYEKAGFVELYRRPGYYTQPVEDAVVMVLWLDVAADE